MNDWQPIETAPKDGQTIRVKLSNGREIEAEFWSGPEGEVDGDWVWEGTQALIDGDTDELAAAEWVGWKPMPQHPVPPPR